jgi:hypothetical protein
MNYHEEIDRPAHKTLIAVCIFLDCAALAQITNEAEKAGGNAAHSINVM